MVTLIYGNPGTGKTETIFRMVENDFLAKRKSILLVPEQMAVSAENELINRLPAKAQLYTEVLNFSRLANKVFRISGGVALKHASKVHQKLIMLRAIRTAAPLLAEYSRTVTDDRSFADSMLSTYNELTSSGISLELLESVPIEASDSALSQKIKDIVTVCSIYSTLMGETYTDTNDELIRLSNVLNNKALFSDTNIYIDGFSTFTGIEHNIIKSLMSQAQSVSISISLPNPMYSGIDTVSIERCSDIIRRNCASLGIHAKTLILDKNIRAKHAEIAAVSDSLWSMNRSPAGAFNTKTGSIELIRANDIYDECEIAASKARQLIESGYRFRDIAIVARDLDSYRGIVEPALENAELRYFISDKTDPSLNPISRLILSAIKIAIFGWRRNDVISHLKTGLCGISAHDADIFELYTAKWNISGKKFLSDDPWNMNPDGYTTEKSIRGEQTLLTANRVRSEFITKLKTYVTAIKNAHNYKDLCIATVNYLDMLNVRDSMISLSARYIKSNRMKEAGEHARMYNTVLDALDCICDTMADDNPVNLNTFATVVHAALSESEIGSIPTSTDEVLVASADMIRANNIKCMIILGACDGEFPSNPKETGLFSDRERSYLINKNIQLSSDKEMRSSDELYYFRRAASLASEKLVIFTRADSEPSIAFTRIKNMFSDITVHETSIDVLCRLKSKSCAKEYLQLLQGTEEGEALRRLLGNEVSDQIPISAEKDRINSSLISDIIGAEMSLSQSKIETFHNCKFAYSCKYYLNLDEGKRAEFAYDSIGTFVHHVLEKYLYKVFVTYHGSYPTESETSDLLDSIISNYCQELIHDQKAFNARLNHTFKRLKTVSTLMINDILSEFSDSSFKPEFFELKIGTKSTPSVKIPLNSERTASISGVIDRVDVYRNGENAFIRVVDYKTGSKTFSLSDISDGVNLQLLLYIFSLTKAKNSSFINRLNAHPVPAGITYLTTPQAKVNSNSFNNHDSYESALKQIKRSGFILDDPDIVRAVSHSQNNRYLMRTSKKDSAISSDYFEHIYHTVSDIITEVGNEMLSGNANAIHAPGTKACNYCRYASVCRSAKIEK